MRRPWLALTAAICAPLGIFAAWEAYVLVDELRTRIYGIYWDSSAGQWTPVSERATRATLRVMIAIVPLLGAPPLIWLRRFLIANRRKNRAWRGQCWSCGYDVRGAPVNCPECGTPVSNAYATEPRQPGERMGPGTRANITLLVAAPIYLAIAIVLLMFLLLSLSGGV